MRSLKRLLLFAAINFAGFSAASLCFLIGLKAGVFTDLGTAQAAVLRAELFDGATRIWVVCALFSVSYFFLEGAAGALFLGAAFVVPMIYGLSVLFT